MDLVRGSTEKNLELPPSKPIFGGLKKLVLTLLVVKNE